MFDLGLGVSIDAISCTMDFETVELLERSIISTFEWSPWSFWTDYDGEVRNEFTRMLARTGKKVISYHIPFKQIDDIADPDETIRLRAMSRFRAHIHEASRLGSKMLIVHPSTEPIDQSKRQVYIAQLRRSMRELESELKLRKMQLALEFLPRLCMGNTLDDIEQMLDGFDDTFGVCLDVNHLMDKYKEIPDLIRKLGKKLYTLHLSDYDGIDEKHWMPFDGVIDFKALMQALDEIGYTGPFNYETSRLLPPNERGIREPRDPKECIGRIEANYLKMKELFTK